MAVIDQFILFHKENKKLHNEMRTNYFFLHTKHPLNRSTNYTQQPQCTNGMQEGEYIAVIQKSRALLLLFNDRALIRISLHVYELVVLSCFEECSECVGDVPSLDIAYL
jgi:hypothetical protein